MTHLEIYEKLEIIEQKLGEYIEANQVGLKDDIFALQFTMARICVMTIDGTMKEFETRKNFCLACLYINIKSVSQAFNRYLKLDNYKLMKSPDQEFVIDYEYMLDINTDLKNVVIQLSHLAISKDCESVENTAYESLKDKIREEDEDDE